MALVCIYNSTETTWTNRTLITLMCIYNWLDDKDPNAYRVKKNANLIWQNKTMSMTWTPDVCHYFTNITEHSENNMNIIAIRLFMAPYLVIGWSTYKNIRIHSLYHTHTITTCINYWWWVGRMRRKKITNQYVEEKRWYTSTETAQKNTTDSLHLHAFLNDQAPRCIASVHAHQRTDSGNNMDKQPPARCT